MRSGILFLNGSLGTEVLEYLLMQPDIKIEAIVLNSPKKQSGKYENHIREIIGKVNLDISIFETSLHLWGNDNFQKILNKAEFGVSALYGHIIPISSLTKIRILNLHPSLLPIGRGADPIAWSIIEGENQGVSIHEIDGGLDTGPIIFQEQIEVDISMNAAIIYEIAMSKLLQIFKDKFGLWLEGKLTKSVQSQIGTYHKSSELKELRLSLQQEGNEFEKFIREMMALTYNDGRKPILELGDGKKWEVEMTLTEDKNMEM